MFHLHDNAPSFSDLVGIAGTDIDQAGNGSQRGKMFHRLMGGTIFSHPDRIVGKDIDHGKLHDGGEPQRTFAVVAEDQETGAEYPQFGRVPVRLESRPWHALGLQNEYFWPRGNRD